MSRKARFTLPRLNFEDILCNRLVVVALPQHAVGADLFRKAGARDVLLLTRHGCPHPERHEDHVRARFKRPADVSRNNCKVAVLNGRSGLALRKKEYFARFDAVLVPIGASLLAAGPGLMRYAIRRRLGILGITNLPFGTKGKSYLVLKPRAELRSNKRLFGPTGLTPLEILQLLSGLDYVALRRIEEIESGRHEGDLDILVAGDCLDALRELLGRRIGTYPIDAYADNGRDRHQFKRVPYFLPEMAANILASATVTESGVRVPSPRWRYLSYCYHLLFHSSSKVRPGQQTIDRSVFASPRHYDELVRVAVAASAPLPRSFDDIEGVLKREGVFPGMDMIGFYTEGNAFLKARYASSKQIGPGLSVFFVQDYGHGLSFVPEIRTRLSTKFTVLAEGPITPANEKAVLHRVRGGNWLDEAGHKGQARPIYWFVGWDDAPVTPLGKMRRKYPQLDNANTRIKATIKEQIEERTGKFQRLHCSDNTAEALEYLSHLGIADDPKILSCLARSRRAGERGVERGEGYRFERARG
jgi:hypothetical protein